MILMLMIGLSWLIRPLLSVGRLAGQQTCSQQWCSTKKITTIH